MADYFLVVIPADPNLELPETAEAVRIQLAAFAGTDEARVKDYGKLQFIDAGQNFESIGCPNCGHDFALPDWHAWMDTDWHGEDGFHLHRHETPCCGTNLTLNDLIYDRPQGFARWFISARNMGRGPLTSDEVTALEKLAGQKLKAIAQRY